jgi:hypothetical protein
MKIILLVNAMLLINICMAQSKKQVDFEKAVKEIVTAFNKDDDHTLNKYIDPKTKIYLLYRLGIFDRHYKYDKINFKDTSYPMMFLKTKMKFTKLTYDKLPTYSCDKEKWTKAGLFVDTTKIYYTLSTICKNLNSSVYKDEKGISQKEIAYYKKLEQQSRRIVCTIKSNNEDLIFHLLYKNGKWYIWIIDKVASDCSA